MEVEMQIPSYSSDKGIDFFWEGNFRIAVDSDGKSVVIKANKEGLRSLAKHLLTLAQNEVPADSHLHYDDFNSLEDGSWEVVGVKLIGTYSSEEKAKIIEKCKLGFVSPIPED